MSPTGEGSRLWGYLLPLLLVVPPAALVAWAVGSPLLIGGVVTAAVTAFVWAAARLSAEDQRRRPSSR